MRKRRKKASNEVGVIDFDRFSPLLIIFKKYTTYAPKILNYSRREEKILDRFKIQGFNL